MNSKFFCLVETCNNFLLEFNGTEKYFKVKATFANLIKGVTIVNYDSELTVNI